MRLEQGFEDLRFGIEGMRVCDRVRMFAYSHVLKKVCHVARWD